MYTPVVSASVILFIVIFVLQRMVTLQYLASVRRDMGKELSLFLFLSLTVLTHR